MIFLRKYYCCLVLKLTVLIFTAAGQSLEYGPAYSIHDPAFNIPTGVAVDMINGNCFIINSGNHRFLKTAHADLLATPLWTEFAFVADRLATDAMKEPQAVAVDAAGNIFIADTYNQQAKLFRWDAVGSIYVYDANFTSSTRTSVIGRNINLPRDIAIGPDGKIYLLDSGNDRILVASDANDNSWQVLYENTAMGNPYGFTIAADNTIYIADTDNHQIIQISSTGTLLRAIGFFGTGYVQFRNPRDVAIDQDGKIYVADTYNHRVQILKPDGTFYKMLGSAPLYSLIQKIEVDTRKRVYIIDAGNKSLIYFPGPGVPKPYDAYIKDYFGDLGLEPSNSAFLLSSPDILVRHHPDIDLGLASQFGLTSFAFEQPRYNENNYVYLAIRNRGNHVMNNLNIKLYYADPGSALNFPAQWKTDGLYSTYLDETSNTPGNSWNIPSISPEALAAQTGIPSVAVVGPFIWRPPAPETPSGGDGKLFLLGRILQIDDPSEEANGINQIRLNNNVALRKVTISRGPFPVGDQNTLVIKTQFPDVPDIVDEADLSDKIDGLGIWVKSASYDLATVKPVIVGPITLDNNKTFYLSTPSNSLLVEMAGEAINKILAANPDILNGPTADPVDDIDRIILAVNDNTFVSDWATTGLWPYAVPGGDLKYLTVSVQGPTNTVNQYAHGISHQFGLQDLYPYSNVSFPIAHPVDPYDNMALPINGAHPLAWSKQLATWITSAGGKIFYIPRPPKGTPPRVGEPPILLSYQAILQSNQNAAIAIGLTEGVTTFEEEHHFYWVEARNPAQGNYENVLPAKGVIAYYGSKIIKQGHVPVIIRDRIPLTPDLSDAMLTAGQNLLLGGTGIEVIVEAERPDEDGGFDVIINYTPPVNDFNAYITKGNPEYISPDIWIDNQRDGNGYASYDPINFKATMVNEAPIGGEENRIFARVHNTGPGVAHDIEVEYFLSSPYTTVGGEGQFDLYLSLFIETIPSGGYRDVFVTWTPDANDDPHNCVRVELKRLVSDIDPNDNEAQQNFHVRNSTMASPYREVVFPFQLRNDEDTPQLYYFHSEGIPKVWLQELAPNKKLLLPGEIVTGQLKVKPPEGYEVCTNHQIQITAWQPADHTLVQVGGAMVDIQLRNQTELTLFTDVKPCHLTNDTVKSTNVSIRNAIKALASTHPKKSCGLIIAGGCTNPARPNEKVVVCYVDPSGNPVYHEVMTDQFGCFQDFNVVVEGGTWETNAFYPGNNCSGPAKDDTIVFVPIPVTGDQDGDHRPDSLEVQGDADGDGWVGQLDPDSDNDGKIDGDETDEDCDRDGLPNVIDPDSDNDGIMDGRDKWPCIKNNKKDFTINPFLGLFVTDDDLSIRNNLEFGVRVEYSLNPLWSLEAEGGIVFTEDYENNSGEIIQANLNLVRKINTGTSPVFSPYLTSGFGVLMYRGFASDQTSSAFNIGGGWLSVLPFHVNLRFDNRLFVGSKIYTSKKNNFNYQASLGVVLSIK